MFEGFGPEKLLFLFLIVLLFFGGKRIPEIGASLGKGIREFKRGIKEVGDSVNADEVSPVHPATSLPAGTAPANSVVYDDNRGAPKRLLDS
ncbi:MAG: Sec-independent protein translocase subunit TatA/TatB [Gemmatimonadaceae bacterium]